MTPHGAHSSTRRQLLMALGSAGAAALLAPDQACAATDAEGLQTFVRKSQAMGTSVTMTVLHRSREVAERALTAAFEQLKLLDSLLSVYRPDSQVSILNRDGILNDPHPCLVEILRKSIVVSQKSDGAFDVTVQPLWELYAAAVKKGELPKPEAVQALLPRIGWQKLEVSEKRIAMKEKGMAITLNAIAQGYAADRVLTILRSQGIENALVDTGELGAMGRKADGSIWSVGIQHPRQADAYVALAKLDNCCMSTSGDYATSFTPDHLYNHIFNPKTGVSPRLFSSVTVVCPSGADADALSTAIFVTGQEIGQTLLRSTPGAEALFVLKDGTVLVTPGFPRV